MKINAMTVWNAGPVCASSLSTKLHISPRTARVCYSQQGLVAPKSQLIFAKCGLNYMVSWNSWTHSPQFNHTLFTKVRKRYRRGYRGVVRSSLFGVGAPEVLVIAVVALLVFGPKGLAEIARSLGQSLRAFQPTIRELQEVSRDFKQTLEKEIGLDDLNTKNSSSQNPQVTRSPVDELTAQLSLMQQEKETKAAQNTEAVTKAPESEDILESKTEEIPESPETMSEYSGDNAVLSTQETTVNNVAKD